MRSIELRKTLSVPRHITVENSSAVTCLISEYEKLKDEQLARIRFRDNQLYVSLVVDGVIAGYALRANNAPASLLMPLVGLIMGWGYVTNREKVTALGRYMSQVLRPRATQLGALDAFGWELAPQRAHWRRWRKSLQLVVEVTTFVLVPEAGPPVIYSLRHQQVLGSVTAVVAFAIETVLISLIAFEILRLSDVPKWVQGFLVGRAAGRSGLAQRLVKDPDLK